MHRKKQLWSLCLVVFFGYLGYSLFVTVFTPLFLSPTTLFFEPDTPLDIRIFSLGVTLFLYPFGQFVSSPILGAFSDRYGRKPILIYSILVSMLMYLLIGIAVWVGSLFFLMSCLLLAGFAEGNLTIAQSAVADISTKRERGKLFGLIYVSTSCSYLIGPLLGGKFANPQIFHRFSHETPFFFISFLLFLMFLWLTFSFKETLKHHKRNQISFLTAMNNIRSAVTIKRFRFIFIANFLIYLAIFGFFQNFPLYIVHKFNVGVGKLSLFIAWSSLPFLIVNLWIIGPLTARFSPRKITAISAIFLGIFLEILLVPNEQNALWITLFLTGLAVAICLPASSVLISLRAGEHHQGRILGVNQSLQFLTEALAGLLVGIVAAAFINYSLIFFGVLGFLGAALLLIRGKKRA